VLCLASFPKCSYLSFLSRWMHGRHRQRGFHVRYVRVASKDALFIMLPCYGLRITNYICCLYFSTCLIQPRGCAVPSVAPVCDATTAAAYYSANASSTIPFDLMCLSRFKITCHFDGSNPIAVVCCYMQIFSTALGSLHTLTFLCLFLHKVATGMTHLFQQVMMCLLCGVAFIL
jgi:hypothetical protein